MFSQGVARSRRGVVGGVRPAVRPGDAEISEQKRRLRQQLRLFANRMAQAPTGCKADRDLDQEPTFGW
jgi:hypothetical protein